MRGEWELVFELVDARGGGEGGAGGLRIQNR